MLTLLLLIVRELPVRQLSPSLSGALSAPWYFLRLRAARFCGRTVASVSPSLPSPYGAYWVFPCSFFMLYSADHCYRHKHSFSSPSFSPPWVFPRPLPRFPCASMLGWPLCLLARVSLSPLACVSLGLLGFLSLGTPFPPSRRVSGRFLSSAPQSSSSLLPFMQVLRLWLFRLPPFSAPSLLSAGPRSSCFPVLRTPACFWFLHVPGNSPLHGLLHSVILPHSRGLPLLGTFCAAPLSFLLHCVEVVWLPSALLRPTPPFPIRGLVTEPRLAHFVYFALPSARSRALFRPSSEPSLGLCPSIRALGFLLEPLLVLPLFLFPFFDQVF